MLSKEEIEKAKDFMIFYKNYCLNKETVNIENYETVNDEEFVYKNIEILLEYIDQLESEKQKLIEKLEKDIKYYECDLLRLKQIGIDENDEQVITDKILIDKYKEILSILKGEK